MQPGIYKLVNCIGGSAMDLSGGDYRSIIGFPVHDGDNQKWEFTPFGAGYAIKSMSTGLYLTVQSIDCNAPLVASPYPVSWCVERGNSLHETIIISWPDMELVVSLGGTGSSVPGTKVQLQRKQPYETSRLWRATRCFTRSFSSDELKTEVRSTRSGSEIDDDSTSTIVGMDDVCSSSGGESYVTTVTTTTTTVTKVVKAQNCVR